MIAAAQRRAGSENVELRLVKGKSEALPFSEIKGIIDPATA